MITFPSYVTPRFVFEFLPKKIYEIVVNSVDKHKFDGLDQYLQKLGIEFSTTQVIKMALSNLDAKWLEDKCLIDFTPVVRLGDYTIQQLIKLIDSGNMEIKGTGVISKAVDYVNKHTASILEEYTNY